jgi:phosphopantothenate synthetase
MEGGYIDFSGPTKFRFRLAEIRNPRLEGTNVCFDFHGNAVEIFLSERAAARWIEYILNPQSLADKLGVREGQVVRVLNLEDSELIEALESKQVNVVHNGRARCDVVMLGVERASELRQLGDLSENLAPGGSIWVVLTKNLRTVTKANVLTVAREAGMSNVKVVDYSETQAAYKIVHPETRVAAHNGNGSHAIATARPAVSRPRARVSAGGSN